MCTPRPRYRTDIIKQENRFKGMNGLVRVEIIDVQNAQSLSGKEVSGGSPSRRWPPRPNRDKQRSLLHSFPLHHTFTRWRFFPWISNNVLETYCCLWRVNGVAVLADHHAGLNGYF